LNCRLRYSPKCAIFFVVSTLSEIEAAVDALPSPQKQELLLHLVDRLGNPPILKRRLPLVPPTGRPITQEEIDDAAETD